MGVRKIKSPRVLITSEGLILIRQENRGEQDSVIVITPARGGALILDLRNACIEFKNRKKKKR